MSDKLNPKYIQNRYLAHLSEEDGIVYVHPTAMHVDYNRHCWLDGEAIWSKGFLSTKLGVAKLGQNSYRVYLPVNKPSALWEIEWQTNWVGYLHVTEIVE